MFRFLKSLLGLILILLLGYVLYRAATERTNDSLRTLRVSADNTTTIVGTVLTNKNDCLEESDNTPCFLKLLVGKNNVYVLYNQSDNGGFCRNEEMAALGKSVKEGSTVKVYGFYKKNEELDTILTCPTPDYYIQVI